MDTAKESALLCLCVIIRFNMRRTKLDVVDSQLECSPFIKETSRKMAELTPTAEPIVLWEKPTFSITNDYIEQLGLKERKKVLGYMDRGEEMVALVGHVETLIVQYEDDNLFYWENLK